MTLRIFFLMKIQHIKIWIFDVIIALYLKYVRKTFACLNTYLAQSLVFAKQVVLVKLMLTIALQQSMAQNRPNSG